MNTGMRKLLVIATLLLGAFAVAQTAGSNVGDKQSANNDWYNQKLAAAVQLYDRIAAEAAPSMTSPTPSGSQIGTQPGSMASNTGSQGAVDDWYNQKLAAAVQMYDRFATPAAPSTTASR